MPSGGYDVFGNLKTINVTKCSALSLSLSMNARNEITNSGFGYNASGDETSDGVYSYSWDAEGRMTSGAGVTYTYDGDGERVKDSSPKLYWYGLNGRVLAETDTSGNTVNEYVYFAGARIARRDASGNVYYSFDKELGSATITTATGSVCYDADYYPFGGEVAFTNTCAQNYKFAGMEQDSASGLYRTMFREYSANYNRWLSPDPYRGSYDLSNPQSFNRYSYVMNNPTNFVDPFGLQQNCNLNGANVDGDVFCEMFNNGIDVEYYYVYATYAPWYENASLAGPDCPAESVCYYVPGGPSGYVGPPAGAGGGGGTPSNGPVYTSRDVCAASALLHNGLNTALDLLGAVPILGRFSEGAKAAIQSAQLAGAVGSAGVAMFTPDNFGGNSTTAAGSSTALGLAAADKTFGPADIIGLSSVSKMEEPSLRVLGDTVGAIPVIGNLFSLGMAVNDIHEMSHDYANCLAGMN